MADKPPPSKQFVFYSKLFPNQRRVMVKAGLPYDVLRKLAPEKFDFRVINDSFAAFLAQAKTADGRNLRRVDHVFYTFDKLQYRGTIVRQTFTDDATGKEWDALNVRLSNDGFCYPASNELKVHKELETDRHRGMLGWVVLDRSEKARFSHVVAFAEAYLGPEAELQFKIFYNFDEDRIDFKVRHAKSSRVLTVCFEPGYPEIPFNDYWL